MKIIGFGAALVDKQFVVKDKFLREQGLKKGLMTLTQEETQENLLAKLKEENYEEFSSCGGSATNSIYAAAALGTNSGFIGKVGNDKDGELYQTDLKDNSIDISNCITSESGKTGNCIVLISPDAERTMNSFLGVSSETNFLEINTDFISSSNVIFIEAYAVTSPDTKNAVEKLIELSLESNMKIALSLSDPNIVEGFKLEIKSWMKEKIDYLFCNFDEAKAFCESENFSYLEEFAKTIFVTNGSKATFVIRNNKSIQVPAFQAEAKDTNGAGDMFAGGVLYGLSLEWEPEVAASFGNFLASKGVSVLGPRLKKHQYKEFLEYFLENIKN